MSAVLHGLAGGWNGQRRQWLAFASALGLELVVIGMLMVWIAAYKPEPIEVLVPLSIETLAAPVVEKPPEPDKVKPPPMLPPVTQLVRAVAPTPAPPAPVATPAPAPPAPVPAPVVAAVTPTVSATPSPIVAAAPAPAAPAVSAPPPTAANVADPSQAYNAKLTAAAQAAFEVPGAVTALGFKGRARVEFNLRDAVAFAVHIVQSSGLGAMDRAALKAVQNAAFPQPPASLRGIELRYQIWVTYDTAR